MGWGGILAIKLRMQVAKRLFAVGRIDCEQLSGRHGEKRRFERGEEREMESSAGVLFFRRREGLEVLLVHPGGPFWQQRDEGAWQIPKGLIEPDESPEAAARREVSEELGIALVEPLLALGPIRQAGGKKVQAFAAERDFDPDDLACNLVEMEWPPRSGRTASFPEIDAARWFPIAETEQAMLKSQLPLIDRLVLVIGGDQTYES